MQKKTIVFGRLNPGEGPTKLKLKGKGTQTCDKHFTFDVRDPINSTITLEFKVKKKLENGSDLLNTLNFRLGEFPMNYVSQRQLVVYPDVKGRGQMTALIEIHPSSNRGTPFQAQIAAGAQPGLYGAPPPVAPGGYAGPPPPGGYPGMPPPPGPGGYAGPPPPGGYPGMPPPQGPCGYAGPPPPRPGGYGAPPPAGYAGPPPPGGYAGPPPPSGPGYIPPRY